ncbi:MAG: tetratricopeptide repeat protein [Candidatus Riflebacteria bacterium]|nr:tetratricopeptide repeat protein [Candidatus Riflebacteria bacterium]
MIESWLKKGREQTKTGDFHAAAHSFGEAIRLNPTSPEPYLRLGKLLLPLQWWEKAQSCFCRAIELQPHYPEAYNLLGIALKKMRCFEKAIDCFQEAIRQKPGYCAAFHNLGNCFTLANRLDEAEEAYQKALQLQPDLPESQFCLGILYLLQGKYEEGLRLYEARFSGKRRFRLTIPIWQGEQLTGCRILLFYEQGFGDMMQFIRYAFEIAKMAAVTTVWIQPPLKRLLSENQSLFSVCDDDRTLDPGNFDFACSIMSLPHRFNLRLETIPRSIPYIHPAQATVKKWSDLINKMASGNLKVGIAWAGDPDHSDDSVRSIPFELISSLFDLECVDWFSLQVSEDSKASGNVSGRLVDFSAKFIDFAETSGMIAALDMVISVDTAVAHLAGAMGKTVWLLLPIQPDWRWGLTGTESHWYSSMRIFRQEESENWATVLEKVKSELKNLCPV